jgi:hypothetical protein
VQVCRQRVVSAFSGFALKSSGQELRSAERLARRLWALGM